MEIDEKLLGQVSDFLSTDEGADIMNKLRDTLGISETKKNDFSSILSGLNNQNKAEEPSIFENLDIAKLIPLVTAISSAKRDNRATNLLLALKPLLSNERRGKIDKAISVMQIMALIPILEEHGFSLGDLFK